MCFTCITFMEKGKGEPSKLVILQSLSKHFLSSRKSMKRTTTIYPPSKQRLHREHFLQKRGCQKPCWDQARLSSLVNKQVALGIPASRDQFKCVCLRIYGTSKKKKTRRNMPEFTQEKNHIIVRYVTKLLDIALT